MSGSLSFFILIPAMYLLFTVALSIIAAVDRKLIAARWAALGFGIATVSIIVDGYKDPLGDPWVSWFTVTTHFLPLLTMSQAFLSRHRRIVPPFAVAMAIVGSVLAMPDMVWSPPHWLRALAVQAICTAIIAAALPQLWAMRRKSVVDMIAFIVIALAGLSYAGRATLLTVNPVGPTQADVIAFYETLNIAFHAASALMGMSVGIVLMMTIGYDILRRRIAEGEVDQLTLLGNRRKLERWIAEHENGERPIGAVLVFDLDHFKRVNDHFGHDNGDIVLRRVGGNLAARFQPFGEVFRTGGEEFVALIREDSAAAAVNLAQTARAAIADLQFEKPMKRLDLSTSVGVCDVREAGDIRQAIQSADSAVYCAKNDGRDRVVAAVREGDLAVLKAVA